MALVLGTNVGFVTVAPTADPAGSNTTIDGSSVVVKHTAPTGARKITEVGWYRGSGTNTANFEIALYSDSGGTANARLFVDNTNSSNVQGWIVTAVNWDITPGTDYWLAVQMDAHTGSSTIDSATAGGAGIDLLTSQTTLNDPYGGGAVSDADGMYAIYALVTLDKEATPGFGELLATGFAATVIGLAPVNVNAGVGAATLTGFAPTVQATNNIVVSSDFGQATLEGFAPVVSTTNNVTLSPGFGDAVLDGYAAGVVASNHQTVLAGTGDGTLSGFAPSLAVTDHKTVNADVGDGTFSGFAPGVDAGGGGTTVLVSTGEVAIDGFAPAVVTATQRVSGGVAVRKKTKNTSAPVYWEPARLPVPIKIETGEGKLFVSSFSPKISIGYKIKTAGSPMFAKAFSPTIQVSDWEEELTLFELMDVRGAI